MTGIFCATARDNVVPIVMEGLGDLGPLGCDCAGLAVLVDRHIQRRRVEGPLCVLEALLVDEPVVATTAIGHTRRGTHGVPSRRNAHPHASSRVAIAHTGVIENHQELRTELERDGVQFRSDTDSEVIVWLLDRELARRAHPMRALQRVLPRLEGSYAVVSIFTQHDGRVYAACRGSPLTVGRSEDASWLASQGHVLRGLAQEFMTLEDGQIAELHLNRVRLFDLRLQRRAPHWTRSARATARDDSGVVASILGKLESDIEQG